MVTRLPHYKGSPVVPVTVNPQLSVAVGGINVTEHCAVTFATVTTGFGLTVISTVNMEPAQLLAVGVTV
jgi:hypothetical protein